MATKPKIPRGCFAVKDWNEDALIVDPKALVKASDLVLVYLPDDLRVRIVGTYTPRPATNGRGTIRIHVGEPQVAGGYHEFDRELIAVAKIVRVDRNQRNECP